MNEFVKREKIHSGQGGGNAMVEELKNVPTRDLVNELRRREGVEIKAEEPYEDMATVINGLPKCRYLIIENLQQ